MKVVGHEKKTCLGPTESVVMVTLISKPGFTTLVCEQLLQGYCLLEE